MADFLDELMQLPDGEQVASEAAPIVETPVETQVEPAATPDPEPAATPTPEPEAPRDEQRTIPLATALNWRDEARESKRRLEQMEAERQKPAQPDPFDDPQGFAAHQHQLVQQAIVQDRFERSNEDAIDKWGEEKVKTAADWAGERAKTNPGFAAEYMSKTRPIHWIVQQHERDALLSDIGDVSKLDDWFSREAAKRGYALQSAAPEVAPVAAAVQPASKPTPPPRSIASERAEAPKVTAEGERDGFLASLIGK